VGSNNSPDKHSSYPACSRQTDLGFHSLDPTRAGSLIGQAESPPKLGPCKATMISAQFFLNAIAEFDVLHYLPVIGV
jgi:hypothetical protein